MTKVAEIHVYGAPMVSRVVWRHGHEEVDLTPLMVGKVEREIGIGNWPSTKVTFHAILVEHHPEPTS